MIKILTILIYILIIYKKIKKIKKYINIKNQLKIFKIKFKNGNNKIIKEKIFKKKLIILYFGYTHCIDICPIIINKIINKIKSIKNFYKILFIFFSIDFKRDNCELLQKYINKYKINNIYGVTEKGKEIEKLSIKYTILYKKTKNLIKTKIKHSNIIFIINKYKNIIKIEIDKKLNKIKI